METFVKWLMGQLVINLEVATNKPNLQMFRMQDHYIFKVLFHKDQALDFQCDHNSSKAKTNKTAFRNAILSGFGAQGTLSFFKVSEPEMQG